MGAAFPAMRAERATRERLKEARVDGLSFEEIRRLEEEERLLDEMSRGYRRLRGLRTLSSRRVPGAAVRRSVSRQERVAA